MFDIWWKERLQNMLSKTLWFLKLCNCAASMSYLQNKLDASSRNIGTLTSKIHIEKLRSAFQTYPGLLHIDTGSTNSWLNLLLFLFTVGKSNMLMIMNFILGSSSLVFNLTTNNYSKQHIFYSPYCWWFSVHGSEIQPQPPRMYQNSKNPVNSGINYSNHNWLAGFLNHQPPSTTITGHAEAPWYSPIAPRQHRHA